MENRIDTEAAHQRVLAEAKALFERCVAEAPDRAVAKERFFALASEEMKEAIVRDAFGDLYDLVK
jgi:hypothetical protein